MDIEDYLEESKESEAIKKAYQNRKPIPPWFPKLYRERPLIKDMKDKVKGMNTEAIIREMAWTIIERINGLHWMEIMEASKFVQEASIHNIIDFINIHQD